MDLREELKIIAYHEAGHALLRAMAGFDVTAVAFSRAEDGRLFGATIAHGKKGAAPLESEEHRRFLLGGYAAMLIMVKQGELRQTFSESELRSWARKDLEDDMQKYFNLKRLCDASLNDYCTYSDIDFYKDSEELAVPILKDRWKQVRCIALAVIGQVLLQESARGFNCSSFKRICVDASYFKSCLECP